MGSEDEHFGYLHVLGGVSGIDGHICNVIARKRLDALVELGSAGCITMETDVAEVGLDEAGLEVGDANSCIGHVDAQSVGEGLHSCFRGTVYIASSIGCIACYAPYIDNVSTIACNHTGHNETCHRE